MEFYKLKLSYKDYEDLFLNHKCCAIIKDYGFKIGDYVHFYYEKKEKVEKKEEGETNLSKHETRKSSLLFLKFPKENLFKIVQVIRSEMVKDGFCVIGFKRIGDYQYD